jgi:hypothetical protein
MDEREAVGSLGDEAAKLFAAARTMVGAARGDHPELADKLTQAVDIVGDAARALAQLFVTPYEAPQPPEPPESPRIQQIKIT